MLKSRIGLILAVLLLSGCDHHKKENQAQAEAGSAAVVQSDSDLTGQPTATTNAVAAPSTPTGSVTTTSSADTNTVSTPSVPSTPTPAVASAATSSPDNSSSLLPATNTAPSASEGDAPRLAMNPVNPVAATNPAPSTDTDSTADEDKVVVLDTSFGHIVIELDDYAAPKTCANFRKLVSEGFYNHTTFHRVIPNFIIQGGDPNSRSDDRASYGKGDPGYSLPAEIKLKHDLGAVAMARLPDSVNPQRESNGSQFYICITPCPSLDDQYTVFGHVIQGMEVAHAIASQPRDQRDNPLGRIPMEARLESRDQALQESSAASP